MKLKNCPFCGGEIQTRRLHLKWHDLYSPAHVDERSRCFMAVAPVMFSDEAALVEAWNGRAAGRVVELENPPYYTPENIETYVAGSSGTIKAAIDQAVADHLKEEERIWLQGEGTDKPKGLLP